MPGRIVTLNSVLFLVISALYADAVVASIRVDDILVDLQYLAGIRGEVVQVCDGGHR